MFEVTFWLDTLNKDSFFLLRVGLKHQNYSGESVLRGWNLGPLSTERFAAQSFGCDRISQLDLTFLFCGHFVFTYEYHMCVSVCSYLVGTQFLFIYISIGDSSTTMTEWRPYIYSVTVVLLSSFSLSLSLAICACVCEHICIHVYVGCLAGSLHLPTT